MTTAQPSIDFDAALKPIPRNVSARFTRANARVELGDMDGAGEDYDRRHRGAARAERRSPRAARLLPDARSASSTTAFADIEDALNIEPDMPYALSARAALNMDAGDIDAALNDANQTVQLDPKAGGHARLRGTVKHIQGDLAGAIADYRTAGKLDPSGTVRSAAAVYLALSRSRAGAMKAKPPCASLLSRWPQAEWPAPLARRLLGMIDDAAILQKAANSGTEVLRKYQDFDWHFYLGALAMIERRQGPRPASISTMRSTTDMRQFLEYSIARVFLERLGGRAYLKTN